MSISPDLIAMDTSEDPEPWSKSFHRKASRAHSKVPYINKLPFSAVAIIILLILVNFAAWIVAIIALVKIVRSDW